MCWSRETWKQDWKSAVQCFLKNVDVCISSSRGRCDPLMGGKQVRSTHGCNLTDNITFWSLWFTWKSCNSFLIYQHIIVMYVVVLMLLNDGIILSNKLWCQPWKKIIKKSWFTSKALWFSVWSSFPNSITSNKARHDPFIASLHKTRTIVKTRNHRAFKSSKASVQSGGGGTVELLNHQDNNHRRDTYRLKHRGLITSTLKSELKRLSAVSLIIWLLV